MSCSHRFTMTCIGVAVVAATIAYCGHLVVRPPRQGMMLPIFDNSAQVFDAAGTELLELAEQQGYVTADDPALNEQDRRAIHEASKMLDHSQGFESRYKLERLDQLCVVETFSVYRDGSGCLMPMSASHRRFEISWDAVSPSAK